MSQIAIIEAPSKDIAAVFNLKDADERFMVETIQRFHGEDRLYRAHALKRRHCDAGRVVIEIASFNPPHKARRFMLIFWEIDTVTIRFQDCESMKAAQAIFATL